MALVEVLASLREPGDGLVELELHLLVERLGGRKLAARGSEVGLGLVELGVGRAECGGRLLEGGTGVLEVLVGLALLPLELGLVPA